MLTLVVCNQSESESMGIFSLRLRLRTVYHYGTISEIFAASAFFQPAQPAYRVPLQASQLFRNFSAKVTGTKERGGVSLPLLTSLLNDHITVFRSILLRIRTGTAIYHQIISSFERIRSDRFNTCRNNDPF